METGYWLFGSLAIFPLVVKWVGELMEFIDDKVERRKNGHSVATPVHPI
jgi:hypothetical protein